FGGTTREDIQTPGNGRIGIQHWEKQGVVGRGILVDYVSWAKEKDIKYSSFSLYVITLAEMKEVRQLYKDESRPGDVLFIRIGLIREWDDMTAVRKDAYG
ncbi:hypothetical protein V1525DRAFT_329982, partial [Lipomyces kononenkoae]